MLTKQFFIIDHADWPHAEPTIVNGKITEPAQHKPFPVPVITRDDKTGKILDVTIGEDLRLELGVAHWISLAFYGGPDKRLVMVMPHPSASTGGRKKLPPHWIELPRIASGRALPADIVAMLQGFGVVQGDTTYDAMEKVALKEPDFYPD